MAIFETQDATRPGSVSPREEKDAELLDDIGVGDVEMVLEHGDWDEASELVADG